MSCVLKIKKLPRRPEALQNLKPTKSFYNKQTRLNNIETCDKWWTQISRAIRNFPWKSWYFFWIFCGQNAVLLRGLEKRETIYSRLQDASHDINWFGYLNSQEDYEQPMIWVPHHLSSPKTSIHIPLPNECDSPSSPPLSGDREEQTTKLLFFMESWSFGGPEGPIVRVGDSGVSGDWCASFLSIAAGLAFPRLPISIYRFIAHLRGSCNRIKTRIYGHVFDPIWDFI